MQTTHTLYSTDAANLPGVETGSVALVVTSPPYPVIAMWNNCFAAQNGDVAAALAEGRLDDAFEGMHVVLDRVWHEVDRVLIPGGIACVNIGDATQKDGDHFRLFSNHSRVINTFMAMGYHLLPDILWRKPTNAPNKFMGSGMYPPGAYVTLEHEYILIFRKGGKRTFKTEAEKQNRRRSAYFWEERNRFFSDLWELKGAEQTSPVARGRSAAFPYEIARRLVLMFSVQGDTVFDPFAGTLTTALAAMGNGRNSLSAEIDADLCTHFADALAGQQPFLAGQTEARLRSHQAFVALRREAGDDGWYTNTPHGFEVKTRQEIELYVPMPTDIVRAGEGIFHCRYR